MVVDEHAVGIQARANKLPYDWDNHVTATPAFVGRRYLDDVGLDELAKYIDWTYFFSAWELKGTITCHIPLVAS